uniref:Uncharacterized protein n=1 Tax=Caenorhabditis tropicalis TaxID=1561998 RepID=A0A1I7T6U1_9PELO
MKTIFLECFNLTYYAYINESEDNPIVVISTFNSVARHSASRVPDNIPTNSSLGIVTVCPSVASLCFAISNSTLVSLPFSFHTKYAQAPYTSLDASESILNV